MDFEMDFLLVLEKERSMGFLMDLYSGLLMGLLALRKD